MKLIKKVNKKLLVFMALLITLVTASLKTTAHAEIMTGKPNWDPTIYDTDWTMAKVQYWNVHEHYWWCFGLDKTYSFIRITDQKDEFINDVTRLEASYYIGNQQFWVNREISASNMRFEWGNIRSKEGQFSTISEAENSHNAGQEFYDSTGKISKYQACNYKWAWNFNVERIVYLYVWYLNPDGKEVAASFMPNGAHPKYDSTGMLKGIYTVEGELLDDYNVGVDGIIENEKGEDVVSWKDQFEGGKSVTVTFGDILGFGDSGLTKGLSIAIYVAAFIVCGVILFVLFLILRKLWRWLK